MDKIYPHAESHLPSKAYMQNGAGSALSNYAINQNDYSQLNSIPIPNINMPYNSSTTELFDIAQIGQLFGIIPLYFLNIYSYLLKMFSKPFFLTLDNDDYFDNM